LVNVASAPIKRDLGLSDSQFGLLSGTGFVILYCLCGIPLGRLADRVDRRGMGRAVANFIMVQRSAVRPRSSAAATS
jgi:MFS family permease